MKNNQNGDIVKKEGIFVVSGKKVFGVSNLSTDKIKRTATVCVSDGICADFPRKFLVESMWILNNCILSGDFRVRGDLQAKENFCFYGNMKAKNVTTGNNFSILGNINVGNKVQIGNNCVINGNIDCKELVLGENVRIYGYIRAEKIKAGSSFFSNNEVTCKEFITEKDSKLLGYNTIKYFYSQNNITLNGGNFREIYTNDKFLSTSSINTNRLIVDKGATIDGNVVVKEFMRVGDNCRIIGNIRCEGYFEYGPGTVVFGKKKVKHEKELPSFSVNQI